MKFLALLSAAIFLFACTPHDSADTEPSEGFLAETIADLRSATLSDEEKQAIKDRATLRERHRKQGLRVCEEGEDGTTWMEDCKRCRCENGSRTCPAIHCTHARERQQGPRQLPPPNRP